MGRPTTALGSVAFGGWTGGALAALDFAGVAGEKVLCPSNTFMATPLAIQHAGGRPVFVDCNRDDLVHAFEDFVAKAERTSRGRRSSSTSAATSPSRSSGSPPTAATTAIFLIEDCAHAHGADFNGVRPGAWGDAGVYSFYATKTISTGEGGMLVSRHPELLDHARAFRNYGKPDYEITGLNFRISEFTAAIGLVQTRAAGRDRRGQKPRRARSCSTPRTPTASSFPTG